MVFAVRQQCGVCSQAITTAADVQRKKLCEFAIKHFLEKAIFNSWCSGVVCIPSSIVLRDTAIMAAP